MCPQRLAELSPIEAVGRLRPPERDAAHVEKQEEGGRAHLADEVQRCPPPECLLAGGGGGGGGDLFILPFRWSIDWMGLPTFPGAVSFTQA